MGTIVSMDTRTSSRTLLEPPQRAFLQILALQALVGFLAVVCEMAY